MSSNSAVHTLDHVARFQKVRVAIRRRRPVHTRVFRLNQTFFKRQDFKGTVATESSGEDYKIERWAANAARRAAYVVFPTDAEDISHAILVCCRSARPD